MHCRADLSGNVQSQHPPDEEQGNECQHKMSDPLTRRFRFTQIEHEAMVAPSFPSDRLVAPHLEAVPNGQEQANDSAIELRYEGHHSFEFWLMVAIWI
jgi:hypothetical protein